MRLHSQLNRRCGSGFLGEESGYTLVESVVAMSLLVSVLIPAAATVTYLLTQNRSEQQIQALGLAQGRMEELIAEGRFRPRHMESADGAWRVSTEVVHVDGVAVLSVRVYRGRADREIVALTTMRQSP